MPQSIRIAAAFPAWLGGLLPSADGDLWRELVVALAALAVLGLTLPRQRRRLWMWPFALVLFSLLPFVIALLFPDSATAPTIAVLAARFFLLASLLQSVLLVLVVAVWERIGRPIPRIFLDLLRWAVSAAALIAILYEAGLHAESLFTGSAVVTAVLGFALRDTLGNVFAGLAIHAEHPFELGDWIQYDANAAHIGRVVEINWRATKVLTLDEAFVIIPNGQLAQASIRNFTKPDPWSRRSVYVITPYDVPPQRVQRIILDAVRGSFGVLEQPAPSVVTNDFKDRGVEHWVRFFTTEFDKRDRVDGMVRDRIWYALAREGIEIPVATHAVRLVQLPAPAVEPADAAVARREHGLRGVGVLRPLDAGQIRRLAERTRERTFAAGEQVVHEGDPGTSLFVVLSGRVAVTARGTAGPGPLIAELGPGEYFGEMSLLTGAPRLATVTAVAETRLVEVCKEAFAALVAASPGLVETMGGPLRARLAERNRAVAGAAEPVAEPGDVLRMIREFFSPQQLPAPETGES